MRTSCCLTTAGGPADSGRWCHRPCPELSTARAREGGIRNRRHLERRNKSVPNYAAVFEGPKPFFSADARAGRRSAASGQTCGLRRK